jgi:hypothetical protein
VCARAFVWRQVAPWLTFQLVRNVLTVRWLLRRFVLPYTAGYTGLCRILFAAAAAAAAAAVRLAAGEAAVPPWLKAAATPPMAVGTGDGSVEGGSGWWPMATVGGGGGGGVATRSMSRSAWVAAFMAGWAAREALMRVGSMFAYRAGVAKGK